MIVGQNSLLNQYVPTFQIKCLLDGQILVYDSCRKAFVNAPYPCVGTGGAQTLGELLDVNDSVDDPLTLHNGQALIYDESTGLWINQYVDYNTLINVPAAGLGTVTSVTGIGTEGVTVDITNPTTTPYITVGLGDITPLSITTPGNIIGANLSGTNTGDQIIVLTGDATNSDTSTGGVLTLIDVNPTTGTFGSSILVPQITVDAKGRVLSVVNIPITTTDGTVTSVSGIGLDGVDVVVTDPTTTPNITISLGDITPDSVTSAGPVTGSNISGTNTGDQIIVLTGDATNSDTSTGGVLTLATVNATPGIYGDDHFVPTITVNAKGLVTSVTTQHVDTSVRDLVPDTETLTIAARHQYIVTTELQVDGYIINNGVIAIL